MSDKEQEFKSNIVEKKDLGNGKKQVTLRVDGESLEQYIKPDSDKKLGTGIVRSQASVKNRYEPTDSSYLSQYNSNGMPYTTAIQIPSDPHDKIKLARELYYKEPIVGTVVDMMVDFSSSGFTNECEDREIKELFDTWANEINLPGLIEQIFLEYFRSSNVPIYRNSQNMNIRKKEKVKGKSVAKADYVFPSGYTILNPTSVSFQGSLMFGNERAYLDVTEEMINMVNTDDSASLKLLPIELVRAVRSGDSKFPLNSELFSRITRKRQPYERYATPSLERIFEPVLYKQKLRSMDMSTIEGLVNQLVTVRVGNDEYPATNEDLEAIATLFQTPNKAYTVFWNHTLEVKFHKPEGLDSLDQDKYKQVNEDILMGLGISRALIDGSGGSSFSSSWVSVLTLIERLENTRGQVQHWLEKEYKRICDENDFKVVPKVQFNKMNLREDNYVRDVLLAMYDRGLIDEENLLQETGRDYNSIIETKKRNKKNSDLFLPPEQPFQGGNTSPNDGRPNGKNQNGYKDRDTSPEQNEGNAPKAKASSPSAYFIDIEEDYKNELIDYYNNARKEIASIVEENKDVDRNILVATITGAIMGMLKSLSYVGDRYIDTVYNEEIAKLTTNINTAKSNQVKADLKQWNRGHVNKLAVDITNAIIANIDDGLVADVAVNKAFNSNVYRVQAMSEAVVLDSTRQAKINASEYEGLTQAVWRAHLDDKTCSTCRGLDGHSFGIASIPPRPHSHCRCELDFY